MSLEDLRGRVAVVTGAGSGIGRALVHRMAADGLHVHAVDVEQAAVEQTASDAPDAAASLTTHVTDVADHEAVGALADTVFTEHDTVHLLCNNAGVFQGGLAWERTAADWEWVMGVNLYGLIHGVDAFLPRMLEAGEPGRIVNTASMAGHICGPYSGPYQVSKFAAYGYSESLAHDLAAIGSTIGVSVLCPSLIATGIGTSSRNRPASLEGATGEDTEFVEQMLGQMTTELGLDPAVVADQVLAAVTAGEFFIPTNDDYGIWIQQHADDLIARRLPRIVDYT